MTNPAPTPEQIEAANSTVHSEHMSRDAVGAIAQLLAAREAKTEGRK